jgi:hypothetical protein
MACFSVAVQALAATVEERELLRGDATFREAVRAWLAATGGVEVRVVTEDARGVVHFLFGGGDARITVDQRAVNLWGYTPYKLGTQADILAAIRTMAKAYGQIKEAAVIQALGFVTEDEIDPMIQGQVLQGWRRMVVAV